MDSWFVTSECGSCAHLSGGRIHASGQRKGRAHHAGGLFLFGIGCCVPRYQSRDRARAAIPWATG